MYTVQTSVWNERRGATAFNGDIALGLVQGIPREYPVSALLYNEASASKSVRHILSNVAYVSTPH